ncbi:SipW-dependent-type signal peptide-containing protein [Dysosmobacter sp.]|uniref:SipW-dependent-type signal peptide-containing protein n=1 Tax=Dysosmobacter sp. TaxID=2591382 RepID=UPI002A8597DB|nr:SipW-dependent-type signal peptide-containing protein [Dysosmobacter sp.]MDY3986192.1 SipW-dependent-type signal peptide-containing protein [Dysosmobacter sp.]
MKMRKILAMVMALALTAALAVGGTLAYLTSTDSVQNTFTVGKVAIKLDEAKANANGTLVEGADRVKANSYKLLPGHTYNKDPMVTVLKDSESSYIKMTVTFSKAAELDAIFAPSGANMTSIFKGYDSTNWISKGNTEDTTANTRTYEFWYKEAVAAPTADVALDALFDQIVVPGSITNAQLETIAGMTITVNAYAIQADGFASADAAWTAFEG